MNRDEFIAAHPIARELESRGVTIPRTTGKAVIKCPFHDDKTPSMSVDFAAGIWNCFAGCGGGSVIDLIARFDGTDPKTILRAEARRERDLQPRQQPRQPEKAGCESGPKPQVECTYAYNDVNGSLLYEVVRFKPKTFRQRHRKDGNWVWSMEGVQRVLYRLPDVTAASCVWIVEGEKDADALSGLGLVATCNVGGAGKWLESYSDDLRGKEVVICGDNDAPGQAHVDIVRESLQEKVKTLRIVELPKRYKDVSDLIADRGDQALPELEALLSGSHKWIRGLQVPIYNLADLEAGYVRHLQSMQRAQLKLGAWLPSLGRYVRPLVQGEFVTILADTGVGKTAILQNLAVKIAPLRTLFFELELPAEMLFERFMSIIGGCSGTEVETEYMTRGCFGEKALSAYGHIFICNEPRITPVQLREFIDRSELRIGERPQVVILDYLQLVSGSGNSRYEQMSSLAEEIKIIARQTRTVIIAASQVRRRSDGEDEIYLHDAKDSGSIENSSGLVLGCWRDSQDATRLLIKVLKNTKGKAGFTVPCNFDGEKMRITEREERTAAYEQD